MSNRVGFFFVGILIAAFTSPSQAQDVFFFDSTSGVFVNPTGGENQGVGTALFLTGDGLTFPTQIAYTSRCFFINPGCGSEISTDPVFVGQLTLRNGVNTIGTTATSVNLIVVVQGTLINLPIIATTNPTIIRIRSTPNTTGNAVADGDVFTIGSTGKAILVPENETGEPRIRLIGRLNFPDGPPPPAFSDRDTSGIRTNHLDQSVAIDDQYFSASQAGPTIVELEIVDIESVQGQDSAIVIPNPIDTIQAEVVVLGNILKRRGVIPVKLFSSETLDASDINPETLAFGPGQAVPAHDIVSSEETWQEHVKDLNGDGRLDLMLHFRADQTAITPDEDEVCLEGRTFTVGGFELPSFDGTAFQACWPTDRNNLRQASQPPG